LEFLKGALGAVLGLIGTLIVALLGYRQWKKQQDLARYGGFLTERQTAYKELWRKLEAVHLSVRSEEFREGDFRKLVREVNVYLIDSGLHFDPGEKKRVNDYMAALGNLGKVLAESAASDTKAQAQQSLYDTTEIPEAVLAQVKGLRDAYSSVEQQRELLITHFRSILGAHLFK